MVPPDFAALSMAWLAFRMARRPADRQRTYGFDRLTVLAAFANGIALFLIAAWIIVEAARRLAEHGPLAYGWAGTRKERLRPGWNVPAVLLPH